MKLSLSNSLSDLEVSAVTETLDDIPSNSKPDSIDNMKEFIRVVSYSFVGVQIVRP